MRLILKSYIKTFFHNWIEAIGSILFLVIIIGVIVGFLSGNLQYRFNFNELEKTSKPWAYRLSYDTTSLPGYQTNDLDVNADTVFNFFVTGDPIKNPWTNKLVYGPAPIINTNSSKYLAWENEASLIMEQYNPEVKINTPAYQEGVKKIMASIIMWALDSNRTNLAPYRDAVLNPALWGTAPFNKAGGYAIQDFDSHLNKISAFHFKIGEPSGLQTLASFGFSPLFEIFHFVFDVVAPQNLGWAFQVNPYINITNTNPTNNQDKNYVHIEAYNPAGGPVSTANNALKLYQGRVPYTSTKEMAVNNNINAPPDSFPVVENIANVQNSPVKIESNFNLLPYDNQQDSSQNLGFNSKVYVTGAGLNINTIISHTSKTGINVSSRLNFNQIDATKYKTFYMSWDQVQWLRDRLAWNLFNASGRAKRNYDFVAGNLIWFNTAGQNSNYQALMKAVGMVYTSDSNLIPFSDSSIANFTKNITLASTVYIAISIALLILGFVFINFIVKKEINKTRRQLGIFKALGYDYPRLSWVFATKFLITIYIGLIVGYCISIPIQLYASKMFTNGVFLPFEKIYYGPIFMSLLFLLVPLIFVLIAFFLNLYYIYVPVTHLIYGNPNTKASWLTRGVKFVFRRASFAIRIKISFTFHAFGKYMIVIFIFFFALLLMTISLNFNDLFKQLENPYPFYQNDVDHTFKAYDGAFSDTAKKINNSVYLVLTAQKNMGYYTASADGQPPSLQEPSNFFNQTESFKAEAIANQKIIDDFMSSVIAEPPKKKVSPIKNAYLPEALHNKTFTWNDVQWRDDAIKKLAEQAFGGQVPALGIFLELRNPQTSSLIFNTSDSKTQALTNYAALINKVLYNFLSQKFLEANQAGTLVLNPNITSGPIVSYASLLTIINQVYTTKVPYVTSIMPSFQTELKQVPVVNPANPLQTYTFDNGKDTFSNILIGLSTAMQDKKASYFSFNNLPYDQKTETPEINETFHNISNQTSGDYFKVNGINPSNWSDFYQFGKIPVQTVNNILNQPWQYKDKTGKAETINNPIPAIVSSRLSKTLNVNVGSIFATSINKNDSKYRVYFQVKAIDDNVILNNSIFTNANNIRQLLRVNQVNAAGQSQLVPVANNFNNTLVSKRALIKQTLNPQELLAGKQLNIKYYLQNSGMSFGDLPNYLATKNQIKNNEVVNPLPVSDRYQLWELLGASNQANQFSVVVSKDKITGNTIANSVWDPDEHVGHMAIASDTLPFTVIKSLISNSVSLIKQVLSVFQVMIGLVLLIVLVVAVSTVIDEAARFILVLRIMGYRKGRIIYTVIGNYIIGTIGAAFVAYGVSLLLWYFILQMIFNKYKVLLQVPAGLATPAIVLAFVALILGTTWCICFYLLGKRKINEINREE